MEASMDSARCEYASLAVARAQVGDTLFSTSICGRQMITVDLERSRSADPDSGPEHCLGAAAYLLDPLSLNSQRARCSQV